MKNISLMLAFLLAIIGIQAQDMNREFEDERTGRKVLVGQCDREGMQNNEEFAEFYSDYYTEYEPNKKILKKIRRSIKGEEFDIRIVMGTWCHDSKLWVPRFYKLIDELGIPEEKTGMVCVDTRKKAIIVNIDELGIERVPTFIVFNEEGEEVGRIIESPYNSLEKDFLKIVKQL